MDFYNSNAYVKYYWIHRLRKTNKPIQSEVTKCYQTMKTFFLKPKRRGYQRLVTEEEQRWLDEIKAKIDEERFYQAAFGGLQC